MKSIVPYTKEIEFGSKIAEICSISLEHELNINDTEIGGNFIVSGDYRSHEVSVNKETFNYKLPFSVDVTDQIIKESIDFEITDFTYEILNDNTLKVDIEFSVTAEEKKEEEIEKEDIREVVMEEIKDMFEEKEEEEIPLENVEASDSEEEPVNEEDDDRMDQESEELILNSASDKEDEFATYHIHIVSSSDTVESICTTYGIDVSTLKEYNQVENITIGDKIIIPWLDE